MSLVETVWPNVVQYYGVDWLIMCLVFASIFTLGEKRRVGFLLGMGSSALGILFSFQIGSIANGIASFVIFFLNLRGFVKWG